MGGLDDLLMGNVGEGSEETKEQIAARIVAAQAKIAALQKDEASAHGYDLKLAGVLKNVPFWIVEFVAWLLNHDVPSLTILALLTVVSDEAGQICFTAFTEAATESDERADVLPETPLRDRVRLWLRFVVAADRVSTTVQLTTLREDKDFTRKLSEQCVAMLEHAVTGSNQEVSRPDLEKIMKSAAAEWFAKK